MSNTITAREAAAIRQIVAGIFALLGESTEIAPAPKAAAPKKAKAPKAAKADTVVTPVVLGAVEIVTRPNGMLTAACGKAVREALVGTELEGENITGNTKAEDAISALMMVGVEFIDLGTPGKVATPAEVEAEMDALNGVTPEKRKAANKALSEDLRSKGVVPSGSAWEAAKNGERSVKKLKALNAADGLSAPKAVLAVVPEHAPATDPRLALLIAGGFTEADALKALAAL